MEKNKNAIYFFTGIIGVTSIFIFSFVMDVYKDMKKQDASHLISDAYFNIGIAICLLFLPIIASLTFLLNKREETEENQSTLSLVRLLCFGFCFFDIIGLHLMIKTFELNILSQRVSFSIISSIGIVAGLLLHYFLNRKAK